MLTLGESETRSLTDRQDFEEFLSKLTINSILIDFYRAEEQSNRPRIFSMTASPIDAKVDVALAATELETVLDSKIATTEDMSLIDAVKKPDECVLSKPTPGTKNS